MNKIIFRSFALTVTAVVIALCTNAVFGQANEIAKRNNPFAPSPKAKTKPGDSQQKSVVIEPVDTNVEISSEQPAPPRSIARETYAIAKRAANANAAPTRVYRVGTGDVLLIEIKNAGTASNYYTVQSDGTIDFPLAGENVIVGGQTVDEIEDSLIASIKLYETPQISVKIKEYVSHAVLVKGLIEVPGFHQIQRDAVPLYIIRAAAVVSPRASGVTIKRENDEKIESFLLANTNADTVLIYPGDSVEFTGSGDASTVGYYFIGGDIANGGKKDLSAGMTLSQAIMASGGLKGKPQRALIRRRSENGILVTSEFDIKNINSGKVVDPTLNQGDIVEIGK